MADADKIIPGLVWIEHSEPAPQDNLALDEALLDFCEQEDFPGFLRFWEATSTFIVVGYSNKIGTEVNCPACAKLNIPIFRRCTGGGTVLQAPGCLNYALCLPIASRPEFESITATNRFVMERNRAAIATLTHLPISVQGHTDLTIEGVKFSGNAQRRKRNFFLFHGSFLLCANLPLVDQLLHFPSHQPEYRQNRSHSQFIRNLPLSAEQVRAALVQQWNATHLHQIPHQARQLADQLVNEKYSDPEWNCRF